MDMEFTILLAVTSGLVLLVAALTTQLGGAIKSFFTKVIIVPGRAYWAARIDAFGDASMYAAVGSITLDLLGVGQDNLGMEHSAIILLPFLVVIAIAIVSKSLFVKHEHNSHC